MALVLEGAAAAAGVRARWAERDAHHELVPAVAVGTRLGQGDSSKARQLTLVGGGELAASLDPALQMGELHGQHRGLESIEAAVVAQRRVQIALRHAMHGQLADALGQLWVAAEHSAAIAGTAEVLVGKKLKQPASPQLPTGCPAQLAPVAWAQSSITFRPCTEAIAVIRSMSTGRPNRCTGIRARVAGVIAASIRSRSIR